MPYQNKRFLPSLATPVASMYQRDYTKQNIAPPPSYKSRNTTNLPPIAYSNCRRTIGNSLYKDSYLGSSGQPADSAKPAPYKFPSLDKIETSTYRDKFRKRQTLQLPLLPSSPTRRNNPHPMTMNNAFHYPQRGYWVWPHRLIPMRYDKDEDSLTLRVSNDLTKNRKRGPFDTWEEDQYVD